MSLISIIVPVYNVEQYLSKCIESLTKQTLKDIEIILVNDGSTDDSVRICKEYMSRDNRIKLINKINGGLSDARNEGIKIAKGKYIGFVDSDDWVDINMYNNLYDIARKSKADIVQCDFLMVYDEKFSLSDTLEGKKVYIQEPIEYLYKGEYVKNIVVWNKIFKKELFDEIEFPVGKVHEDEFTTYKLLMKAKLMVETDFKMYFYRQREGSITNSGFSIKRLDILQALEERKQYFKTNNKYDLAKITDEKKCGLLKQIYLEVMSKDVEDKKIILKMLRRKLSSNYIRFILNNKIKFKTKVSITLCILNGRLFSYVTYKHNKIKTS